MARLENGIFVDDGVKASPTRAEYLNGTVSFADYHRAIAKDAGVSFAKSSMLPEVRAALARGDEHLNSIPLRRWDMLASGQMPAVARAMRAHGEFWSMAGGVCVAKQAARDAAEAQS